MSAINLSCRLSSCLSVECDGQTGDVIREFVWLGDMLVATIEDGQMYAVHGGHLGQPLMATDAAQSIVWQAELTPFGAALPIVDGDDPGLRFPGQWVEAQTGLMQHWHRDYDPSLGRYSKLIRLAESQIALCECITRYS